jgi:hypothetical protein
MERQWSGVFFIAELFGAMERDSWINIMYVNNIMILG